MSMTIRAPVWLLPNLSTVHRSRCAWSGTHFSISPMLWKSSVVFPVGRPLFFGRQILGAEISAILPICRRDDAKKFDVEFDMTQVLSSKQAAVMRILVEFIPIR